MKITIYELLGMIKDDKAPKKIKYDGMIWKFEEDSLYYSDNVWLDDYCNISQILDDEVEIIEPQEHKIPEKLPFNNEMKLTIMEVYHELERYNYKINEILDYLEEIE